MANEGYKLIHIAFIYEKGRKALFLRKKEAYHYRWFHEIDAGAEMETDVTASGIEEAIRLARQKWQLYGFQTLNCGFRYTLPERDEHGINALFHQMSASCGNSNGIYFDDDVGHNCIVQNASLEAIALWHKLKEQKRI